MSVRKVVVVPHVFVMKGIRFGHDNENTECTCISTHFFHYPKVSSEDEEMVLGDGKSAKSRLPTAPTPAARQTAPLPMPRKSLESTAPKHAAAAAVDAAVLSKDVTKRKQGEIKTEQVTSDTHNQRSQVGERLLLLLLLLLMLMSLLLFSSSPLLLLLLLLLFLLLLFMRMDNDVVINVIKDGFFCFCSPLPGQRLFPW